MPPLPAGWLRARAWWHAGAQIPIEDVPSVQKEVVMRCRQMGKPVIVASHLLQSMIEYPTPTRAEVGSSLKRLYTQTWAHPELSSPTAAVRAVQARRH